MVLSISGTGSRGMFGSFRKVVMKIGAKSGVLYGGWVWGSSLTPSQEPRAYEVGEEEQLNSHELDG